MGEQLVRRALEYANSPDALTTSERMWLVKQAADADDENQRCAMTAEEYGFDEMLARLIAKGALAIKGDEVFFTEMGLGDAFKAYQVMSGVERETADGSNALWYH